MAPSFLKVPGTCFRFCIQIRVSRQMYRSQSTSKGYEISFLYTKLKVGTRYLPWYMVLLDLFRQCLPCHVEDCGRFRLVCRAQPEDKLYGCIIDLGSPQRDE